MFLIFFYWMILIKKCKQTINKIFGSSKNEFFDKATFFEILESHSI